MNKILNIAVVSLIILLVSVGGVYFSDPVFWYRYFYARTPESYEQNPFPTKARLFPQEVVVGTETPYVIPVAAEAGRTIPEAILDRAEAFARSHNSTSLIYIHNGVIQYENYWPKTAKCGPVYSMSMAKTIAALLVGIAFDRGLIDSIDDPIGKYVEEWKEDRRGQEITIRHLLTMSSGLEPTPIYSTNPFTKAQERQIGTDLTKTALSFELVSEPGTKWEYNGVNTFLLGLIIERVSGMRYTEFLSQYLWQPVGNQTAHMWMDHEDGVPRTFMALYAAPMDWARLGVMMLNKGEMAGTQIVSSQWVDAMIRPAATAEHYGFQLWRAVPDQQKSPPGDYYLFIGLGGQTVFVYPSKNIVIVRTGPPLESEVNTEFLNKLPTLIPESLL